MTMVLSEETPRSLVKVRAQLPPTSPPSPDSTPRLTREASNNTPVSHHHHHNHNEISRTDFKMRPPPAPKSAIHKNTKGKLSAVSNWGYRKRSPVSELHCWPTMNHAGKNVHIFDVLSVPVGNDLLVNV